MAGTKITPTLFVRRYSQRAKVLNDLLARIQERPTEDEVHDLRVAARHAQVLHRLLPRGARRNRKATSFNAGLRSLRKATSQVRDYDTLTGTLERFKHLLPAELIVSLKNERSDAAARARVELGTTQPMTPFFELEALRRKKLSKRFRTKVKKSLRTIDPLMKKVASDESRKEDLHTLRKEIKKYRYLLELARGSGEELKVLEAWQNTLGAVHDLDVAVTYVEGSGWDFPKAPAIRELRKERHLTYLKLIHDRTFSEGSRHLLDEVRASAHA